MTRTWGRWETSYLLIPISTCCINDPLQRVRWWDRFHEEDAPRLAKAKDLQAKGLNVAALINELNPLVPYPGDVDVVVAHRMGVFLRRRRKELPWEGYRRQLAEVVEAVTDEIEAPRRRTAVQDAVAQGTLRLDPNGKLESAHYDFFGLSRTFTRDELKKAFRQAALRNHPDHGGSHEVMKLVNRLKERLEPLAAS